MFASTTSRFRVTDTFRQVPEKKPQITLNTTRSKEPSTRVTTLRPKLQAISGLKEVTDNRSLLQSLLVSAALQGKQRVSNQLNPVCPKKLVSKIMLNNNRTSNSVDVRNLLVLKNMEFSLNLYPSMCHTSTFAWTQVRKTIPSLWIFTNLLIGTALNTRGSDMVRVVVYIHRSVHRVSCQ